MLGLLTRIIAYIIAGLLGSLAATFPGLDFNEASGLLTIDVGKVSAALGGLAALAVAGPTFSISRWIKRRGGVT